MRVVYITAHFPFGKEESFLLWEIVALRKKRVKILVVPRSPKLNRSFETIKKPLVSFEILFRFVKNIISHPTKFVNALYFILKSRSIKIFFKNLIVLPKGIWLSEIIKSWDADHIHAHWASTTSTMAAIASIFSGIPWSFTAHRWDIKENNLLKEKLKLSTFLRVIDKMGEKEVKEIIGTSDLDNKIFIIHMGVKLSNIKEKKFPKTFTIMCPANLVIIKGHRYLIEACNLLRERRLQFKCKLAGEGPLRRELEELVERLSLTKEIEFVGHVPHQTLLHFYSKGDISIVVLPSIETDDGRKEGIPVSLMEAMAYGIPVISTYSGGIPELVQGAGLLVYPKDSVSLANAIEQFIESPQLLRELSKRGRKRVEKDFDIDKIAGKLLDLFSSVENCFS